MAADRPGTVDCLLADPAPARRVTGLAIAAWASLGAGAVHAAAIGVHAEHRDAALTFTIVAFLQILWGAAALAAPSRLLALVGAAGSSVLVGGWLTAKTSGIPYIDGLAEAESLQVADTVAAALAAVVVVVGLAAAMADDSGRAWRPLGRVASGVAVVAVVAMTLPALVSASSHDHAGHDDADVAAAGDHGHDDDHGHAETDATGGAGGEAVGMVGNGHQDHDTPVPPKPYDPELPIDLGGVEGVTPQQQAAAENLIAITLLRLPKYADPAVAEADGFRTIRDGATGHEHYINWSYIDDEHVLDPDHPESLVYEPQPDGTKQLVSAMFMLPTGTTLDDVPELGGPLTQWHIHDDLCFVDDPEAPWVAGLTNPDGTCNPPLVKFAAVPMIHVWIVPHPCGPFAALEGVGAGQVAEGETHLCDHAHGA